MAAEFDEWEQVLPNAAVEPENPPAEEAAGPAAAVAGGEEADEHPAEVSRAVQGRDLLYLSIALQLSFF